MKQTTLKLTEIRTDGGTQTRAAIQDDAVSDYAEALEAGDKLPPVTVYFDGAAYWLADGFHRHAAHAALGALEIEADVRQGARRDAVLHSVGANATHGLRRTNEDKRRAVQVLLEDSEWREWSNNEIAKRAGVSHTYVNKLRSSLETVSSETTATLPQPDVRRGADGRTINTANIGKSSPTDYPRERYVKTYSPPLTPEQPEDDDRLEVLPPEPADAMLDALVRREPDVPDFDEVDENKLLSTVPPDEMEDFYDDSGDDFNIRGLDLSRPVPKVSDEKLRVKPPDPSKRRPFERAFVAAGSINRLDDDVIVAALLSAENKVPMEQALEVEFSEAIRRMKRCVKQAENERKTLTL